MYGAEIMSNDNSRVLAAGYRSGPSHAVKQDFAKRLREARIGKDLNQSELARKAGVERDSISKYERALQVPRGDTVQKLARVLGMSPEELLPVALMQSIENQVASFEMKTDANNPGMSWLQVNRLVSTKTALKVASVLEEGEPDATNPGRGRGATSLQRAKN